MRFAGRNFVLNRSSDLFLMVPAEVFLLIWSSCVICYIMYIQRLEHRSFTIELDHRAPVARAVNKIRKIDLRQLHTNIMMKSNLN